MMISENYIQIFKECFLLFLCRGAIVPRRGSNRTFEHTEKKERTLMQIFIRPKDFKAFVREM